MVAPLPCLPRSRSSAPSKTRDGAALGGAINGGRAVPAVEARACATGGLVGWLAIGCADRCGAGAPPPIGGSLATGALGVVSFHDLSHASCLSRACDAGTGCLRSGPLLWPVNLLWAHCLAVTKTVLTPP